MRPALHSICRCLQIIILAGIAAGCSSPRSVEDESTSGGAGGAGSGGSSGRGGAEVAGAGGPGASGLGGRSSDGTGGQAAGGTGGSNEVVADAGPGGQPDASPSADGGVTSGPGGGSPGSYDGDLPLYEGPPVGPVVTMACPEDPTVGWTEYRDTFRVERPYDLPINLRFKLDGGIYTFWVLPGDKPSNATTVALNPRTEARFMQNFKTGLRMWSADLMLEKGTDQVVFMQVHTTGTGIGPVYLFVSGTALAGSSIKSTDIPGGLFDNWFNMKVAIDADTTQSQIYINNCLKSTQTGVRGDGNDFFKMGVYHCSSTLCRDHYKNVHLYQK